jgi:hypothetical protein
MEDDPIVAEVRKNRESILESYNWDVIAMMKDSMKKQWESDRKVVSFGIKKPEQDAGGQRLPLSR